MLPSAHLLLLAALVATVPGRRERHEVFATLPRVQDGEVAGVFALRTASDRTLLARVAVEAGTLELYEVTRDGLHRVRRTRLLSDDVSPRLGVPDSCAPWLVLERTPSPGDPTRLTAVDDLLTPLWTTELPGFAHDTALAWRAGCPDLVVTRVGASLAALDLHDGRPRWTLDDEAFSEACGDPSFDGVAAVGPEDVVRFDADGRRVAESALAARSDRVDSPAWLAACGARDGTPRFAFAGTRLVFATEPSRTFAASEVPFVTFADADLAPLWTHTVRTAVTGLALHPEACPTCGRDGRLYLAQADGTLGVVDWDGHPLDLQRGAARRLLGLEVFPAGDRCVLMLTFDDEVRLLRCE
ncbi:MAG: hypothetical protein H6825_16155 [Planctomycetes bacterium]|nr:hypothetical protein [Planctomycetota bacterium]